MIQEIRKIVKEEGLEGLYAGLAVKLTQSIATAAFLFYFKEELFSGSVKLIEILRVFSFKKSPSLQLFKFKALGSKYFRLGSKKYIS